MSDLGSAITDQFLRGARLLRDGLCVQALDVFRGVYAGAQSAGNTEMMAAALCEIGWSCYRLGEAEQGLEGATSAILLWERLGNRLEMARAMAVQAVLYLELGFSDEAYDLSTRALVLAQADSDVAVLAFVLNIKGIVLTVCHEVELGTRLIEQAVGIANHQKNQTAAGYYLLNLGFCHARMADEATALAEPDRATAERDAAIELTSEAIRLARGSGDLWTLRVALANNAEMLALHGSHYQALVLLEQCAGLPDIPSTGLRIQFLYTLGDVLFRAGRLDDARLSATQAVQLATATKLIDHQVNAVRKLAEILEAQGDIAAALVQHKRFHCLYVRQSGETAQRRARIESIRSETELWRSRAAVLADQALSDPLTGIANRRSIDQILARLAGTPFCLAIVDLDHFKSINDRFSHSVGDTVLQRVALTLVDQLGAHGHAGRLGGEEFALVLPNVPEASATALCEGVRIAVAGIDWSDLNAGLHVTISIGLAGGDGGQSAAVLMQLADARLYAAKAGGRDRVQSSLSTPGGRDAAGGVRRQWRA
ncbi:MAG: diguanylate cyclase [Devosia sp.]